MLSNYPYLITVVLRVLYLVCKVVSGIYKIIFTNPPEDKKKRTKKEKGIYTVRFLYILVERIYIKYVDLGGGGRFIDEGT